MTYPIFKGTDTGRIYEDPQNPQDPQDPKDPGAKHTLLGVDWGSCKGDKSVATVVEMDLAKAELHVLAAMDIPRELIPEDRPRPDILVELQKNWRRLPLGINSSAGRNLLAIFMMGERKRRSLSLRRLSRKRQRHILRQKVRLRFHIAEAYHYPEFARPIIRLAADRAQARIERWNQQHSEPYL